MPKRSRARLEEDPAQPPAEKAPGRVRDARAPQLSAGSLPSDAELVVLRVPASFDLSRLEGAELPEALFDGTARASRVALVNGAVRVAVSASGLQSLRVAFVGAGACAGAGAGAGVGDIGEQPSVHLFRSAPTALLHVNADALDMSELQFSPLDITTRKKKRKSGGEKA
jgi:hypothetical protein